MCRIQSSRHNSDTEKKAFTFLRGFEKIGLFPRKWPGSIFMCLNVVGRKKCMYSTAAQFEILPFASNCAVTLQCWDQQNQSGTDSRIMRCREKSTNGEGGCWRWDHSNAHLNLRLTSRFLHTFKMNLWNIKCLLVTLFPHQNGSRVFFFSFWTKHFVLNLLAFYSPGTCMYVFFLVWRRGTFVRFQKPRFDFRWERTPSGVNGARVLLMFANVFLFLFLGHLPGRQWPATTTACQSSYGHICRGCCHCAGLRSRTALHPGAHRTYRQIGSSPARYWLGTQEDTCKHKQISKQCITIGQFPF